MTNAPGWFLSIAYWLHMLATVAWLGGLSAMAILVIPAIKRSLSPEVSSRFLNQLQNRLNWLGWISLMVLTATGMFQMSSHPRYQGFLVIDNDWAAAIFIKHIIISLMVFVSAYLTWGVLPALNRYEMIRASGKAIPSELAVRLEKREKTLTFINLVLAILVLALTAWARIS